MPHRASDVLRVWVSGLILGAIPAALLANSPPVVSNVTASQRTDGSKKVDIRCNLGNAPGEFTQELTLPPASSRELHQRITPDG